MNPFVIDTNVAVVANGRSRQANAECVLACIHALERVIGEGQVVLDDDTHILHEYMTNLSISGQPGPGDFFMKWVFQNQGVAERCLRVTLHEKPRSGGYLEFPDDPRLAKFDLSDRKFVAVCLASGLSPPILNAVDSDWVIHETVLESYGVRVQNLCPDCIRSTA